MTESLALLILTVLVILGMVSLLEWITGWVDDLIGYFVDPVELPQLGRIADALENDGWFPAEIVRGPTGP